MESVLHGVKKMDECRQKRQSTRGGEQERTAAWKLKDSMLRSMAGESGRHASVD